MVDVLLATARDVPDVYAESPALETAFAEHGIEARWAAWDDPDVYWGRVPLVLVRTTWDYYDRRPEFLSWAERVAGLTTLLNPPETLRWNTHKRYLIDLADVGVPIVQTSLLAPGSSATVDVPSVVKPAVGIGGLGLTVLPAGAVAVADGHEKVLQPLVASIRTVGETSVFVFDGEPVAAVVKHPAEGEVRVHEEYGGVTKPAELTAELASVARRAVTGAGAVLAAVPAYARADLMRLDDGTWAVGELELVEPGLFLDAIPEVADAFARAMAARLGRPSDMNGPETRQTSRLRPNPVAPTR